MARVFNFASRPAALPEEVLRHAQAELLDWQGGGHQQFAMVQLKGHRTVGGVRASIYNAMPLAAARRLVDHMREFQRRHG